MTYNLGEVEDFLAQGVAAGAFPGAVAGWGDPLAPADWAWAGHQGRTRNRVPVTPELLYDLASLTKILATTSLAMIYVDRGWLDVNQPLAFGPLAPHCRGGWEWPRPWGDITPAHLLAHQSGLPPWRPFYRLKVTNPSHRRQAALAAILGEPVELNSDPRPGRATVYSDLNFMLLGFWLEAIGQARLDILFEKEVAGPLNLSTLGYNPRSGPLAPTEDGFRWGGPIGHPQADLKGPTPVGRPHDDNAAWLGGVSGHAGLFGEAASVWALGAEWGLAWTKGEGRLFKKAVLKDFLTPRPTTADGGRPLGFNLRSGVQVMSQARLSPNSVGHLGYTGPSLWWDWAENFMWLFLTNRVHPHALNPAWSQGQYQGGPTKNHLF